MVGLLFRYVVMYISFCSRGSVNGALTKSASEDNLWMVNIMLRQLRPWYTSVNREDACIIPKVI